MTFHMLAYLHKWPWPRWPCRWRWQSWKSWRGQWAVVRETSWLWAASLKPENMWSWGGWTSNQLSINSGMTASEIQALLFINMNRPQKDKTTQKPPMGFSKMKELSLLMVSQSQLCSVHTGYSCQADGGQRWQHRHHRSPAGELRLERTAHSLNMVVVVFIVFIVCYTGKPCSLPFC